MAPMRTNATKLGPWTIQERIAMGGSSEVFLADSNGGPAALKVPRNPRGRDALMHEAKILGTLDHPGIPTLIDADPRGAWLAIEHVNGKALTDWAAEQPLEEVVQLLLRLLQVIGYLHDQHLVHGDLTPSNVLVTADGAPMLIDLGLAAYVDETVPLGFRGTLGYAAPELLRGGVPTTASDLYGFGALAYACLTGRAPFTPQDPAALAYVPLVSVPLPPSSLRPALAGPIDEVILDLLARDPDERPDDLKVIASRLWEGSDASFRTPVLGMGALRDQLRRVALEVLDGEDRVVLLYGPPGCGRRTLGLETVEVARREGARVLDELTLSGLASVAGPAACFVDGEVDRIVDLVKAAAEASGPVLLVIRAERPVPVLRDLGAIELTPPPLGRGDTVRLAVAWGAPEDLAERWWRDSFGHPAAVHGHLRAWLRRQGRQIGDEHLSETERDILSYLADGEPHRLTEIARTLRLGEHKLLDHCEVLFAEGLIESADDGADLRLRN